MVSYLFVFQVYQSIPRVYHQPFTRQLPLSVNYRLGICIKIHRYSVYDYIGTQDPYVHKEYGLRD